MNAGVNFPGFCVLFIFNLCSVRIHEFHICVAVVTVSVMGRARTVPASIS